VIKMAKLQELFTTSSAPEQILTDIYRTVTEAVRVKLIGTQLVSLRYGPTDIVGTNLSVIHQTKNALSVGLVGEGAEIPISTEDTFKYSVLPLKYGVRPLVTKEMQEDSLFAVMERNLTEAGYQMARKMDRLIFAAARQGSGNTVTGGASITVANITNAINNLEKSDYTASDFVIGPDVAWDLRNIDTFVEANKAGVNNPSQSLIGTIFGMKVWVSNNIVSNRVTTSTNATDALVIDKSYALAFAEKRPITVERYNDVTRQLDGITLSARWDALVIPDTDQARANPDAAYTTSAISLITTT